MVIHINASKSITICSAKEVEMFLLQGAKTKVSNQFIISTIVSKMCKEKLSKIIK